MLTPSLELQQQHVPNYFKKLLAHDLTTRTFSPEIAKGPRVGKERYFSRALVADDDAMKGGFVNAFSYARDAGGMSF